MFCPFNCHASDLNHAHICQPIAAVTEQTYQGTSSPTTVEIYLFSPVNICQPTVLSWRPGLGLKALVLRPFKTTFSRSRCWTSWSRYWSWILMGGVCCNKIIWVYPLNLHPIYPLNSSPKLLNYFLSPLLYFTPFLPHFGPFPLLFPIQRVLTAFSVFSCTALFWLGQSQASRPVAPV